MKRIFAGLITVFTSLLILSSCTISSNLTQPQVGAVLAAQLSPDAPKLNLYVNSNNAFDTGMAYTNYTGYATVNPGTYSFSTIPSGTNTSNYNTAVTIEANKYYSFFLIDSFNNLKSAFVNDVFQRPSGDSVYIRFFNFALDLPSPISLFNSAGEVGLSTGRVFNDQALNPQYIAFTEVPAGTYALELHSANDSTIAATSLTLSGGYVYTLVAKGIYNYKGTDTTKALSIGLLENYP